MWQRHRSAPLGALLAGAIALLATGAVAAVFYLSVVRGARGLPAYTAGIPPASIARPAAHRAAYHARVDGPPERATPDGTPSAAHRWRVTAPAAPDDPLCAGEAVDGVVALDGSGRAALELPLPPALYAPAHPRAVPGRIVATCPEAAAAIAAGGALEYTEEVVARGAPVEVVACARRAAGGARAVALAACDDGAPSRVYPRPSAAEARARTRGAMLKVAQCAGAFALACFVAGVAALRRFDRRRAGA